MHNIEINGLVYSIIEKKEIGIGGRHNNEILCADTSDKKYLIWTEREKNTTSEESVFKLISRHFIAELTDSQVMLWKAGNFDAEKKTLNMSELTKMISLQ